MVQPAPLVDNPLRVLVGVLAGVAKGIPRIQVLVVYPVTVYLPLSQLDPGVDETLDKGIKGCVVGVPEPLDHPVVPEGVECVIIAEMLAGYPHHIAVEAVQEVMDVLILVVQHHKLVAVDEEQPVKVRFVLLVEFGVRQGLDLVDTGVVLMDDRRVLYNPGEDELVVIIGEDYGIEADVQMMVHPLPDVQSLIPGYRYDTNSTHLPDMEG